MNLTFFTFALLGVYTFLAAVTIFYMWLMKAPGSVSKDLAQFIEAKDYARAKQYLDDKVKFSLTRVSVQELLDLADKPHRLAFKYEELSENLRKLERLWLQKSYTIVLRVLSILNTAAIAWLLWTAQSTGWNHFWVACWVFVSMVIMAVGRIGDDARSTRNILMNVRNLIYLAEGYIPPSMRPHKATATDLEKWRKALDEIERDVLAGTDIDDATTTQVERIRKCVDYFLEDPDGEPLPRGRLGLLREGASE